MVFIALGGKPLLPGIVTAACGRTVKRNEIRNAQQGGDVKGPVYL